MENIDKKLLQAVKPGRVNFSNLIYSYQAHLPAFQRIEFTLIAHDGVQLPVTLFMKKTEQQEGLPTVIYNHSHGSSRWESSDLIQHCNQLNLNLCLYDSRGCGESSESYIYFGFRERIDLLYLIMHLNIIYRCEEIILWGRSIGCNTVLQFYQTILGNEGPFLTAKVKKLMQGGEQSENDRAEADMFKRYQHSLRIVNYSPNMFSENFNLFIDKYIDDFIDKNIKVKIQDPNFKVSFRIMGIVLDSPYDSFSGFIKDNMAKQIAFLSGLISSPVSLYLKNFYKKTLDIDLDTMQNSYLIKRVNLNTVMFVSDADELIPLDKFSELIHGFAEKCPKKNPCKVFNTKQRHGKKRPDNMLSTAITYLRENINSTNTWRFTHVYIHKAKNNNISSQQNFHRNNSNTSVRQSQEGRAKSVSITQQQARTPIIANNSDVRPDISKSDFMQYNTNVTNRNPFTGRHGDEEENVAQFYTPNIPNFESGRNMDGGYMSNNSNTNANTNKANNRSISPLHMRYNLVGSYKHLEMKQPARNPPMKAPPMQKTNPRPDSFTEIGKNEINPRFNPSKIQEIEVEIVQNQKNQPDSQQALNGRRPSYNYYQ